MDGQKTKYLVYVEDDLDDVEIFYEYFSHLDHLQIKVFPHGKALLEFLDTVNENEFPCMAVLDINTPIMSGWQTAHEMKTHPKFKSIPIVMFSTSNREMELLRSGNTSVDVVTKPTNSVQAEKIAEKLLSYCNAIKRS